eukprot:TRINITY_DN56477_c0_g2_i1.p1 TRINITY_DN56477_c0_g2~~TRINITY_DN56477_c0_g2_i1.p1  ORF type:complete len:194 (-),score=13.77 TRINITY_DN56477_c0_g2_i1:97-678(-)
MDKVLDSRPESFPTLEKAVLWTVKSGGVHNIESARVAVPSKLVECEAPGLGKRFKFRTNLKSSQPFWREWFEGMDSKFLGCSAPKLLFLAGTDRLDKDLLIGQMQGKFQLAVVYGSGHHVHEDKPDEFATKLRDFHKRLSANATILKTVQRTPPMMMAMRNPTSPMPPPPVTVANSIAQMRRTSDDATTSKTQ